MKIIMCTKNAAKIQATRNVLAKFYPDVETVLESFDVPSGVSATPTSDEEGVLGCNNRINNAKKITSGDMYIAMEGIIQKNSFGTFLYGWCAIETNSGKKAYGASGQIQLPEKIIEALDTDPELAQIVKNLYPEELTRNMPEWGTEGVITMGKYTRIEEFETALVCALSAMNARHQ